MLRPSLRTARVLVGRPLSTPRASQWLRNTEPSGSNLGRRSYAYSKKHAKHHPSTAPAVLPASETNTAAESTLPSPDLGVIRSTVAAENIPRLPPTPKILQEVAPAEPAALAATRPQPQPGPASTPPPPPPIAPKIGLFRRVRTALLSLAILGALGFGGAVWYSRISDGFYDIFTTNVPFAERAVRFVEDIEFRSKTQGAVRHQNDAGEKVRIPAQSGGARWRIADEAEPASGSPSMAKGAKATQAAKTADPLPAGAQQKMRQSAPRDDPSAHDPNPSQAAKKAESTADSKPVVASTPTSVTNNQESEGASSPARPIKKSSQISHINLFRLKDASESVIQDLVYTLNDVITVINADEAPWRFRGALTKAKEEIARVGDKIRSMKSAVEMDAAAKVRSQVDQFEKDVKALADRFDAGIRAKEKQWEEELGMELENVRNSYADRLQLLMDLEKRLHEEQLQSQLLAQAITLRNGFMEEIKEQVEHEREGRLSKLLELASSVDALRTLADGYAEVAEKTTRSQQVHVALEAVRACLQDEKQPRPFIRELVALKEAAVDNPLVDAAIASINPITYQRGVSTPAQLIDRFRRVAAEVRKAALLPDDAGVASHASSLLLTKFMFRKSPAAALADERAARGDDAGAPADVESVLARAQAYLEEGNLDRAAREVNGLTGWAKTLSKDWLAEVRRVLEVRQALDIITAEARLQSLKAAASRTRDGRKGP